jgi:hypothetical protein
MLGVELGFTRRMWACRRDWPRMVERKPVWPEEDAPPLPPPVMEVAEELVGRDFVDAGAVLGKAPGRGPGLGLAGKGEGDGGYLEEVRGGEMRCAALLWLLVGREALVGMLVFWAMNGLGIGSVDVLASG